MDGIGLLAGRRLPALVLELRVGLEGPALPRALDVHRRVDRDPVEPGLDAAPAERLEVPIGREERLLDAVRRLIAVGHHPDDQPEELILVADDQIVERVEVAFAGPLEQDQVTALDGVVGDRRRAKVLHGQGVPPDGDCEARRV
jgi:hypothetical protein